MKYDLAIIGSGPGGYVAALKARKKDLKTVLIEKDALGGVCLNRGCIPSKALIHQAELFAGIGQLEAQGLKVDRAGWTYSRVVDKARKAASDLSKGVTGLLKKAGVDIIKGRGCLSGQNTITVDGKQEITATDIILATGSRPRSLENLDFNGRDIISSDEALFLDTFPEHLVIVGGGAIGCEMAYIFSSFGSRVVMCEMMDEILPRQDREIASMLRKHLTGLGIEIITGCSVVNTDKSPGGRIVTVMVDEAPREIPADTVILATGRIPNTEDIGLESAGISTDRGYIRVDASGATGTPGVYAIGDIVPGMQLAHVASREAEIAVEAICGERVLPDLDPTQIPYAVYTVPEMAGFGYTEEELKEKGRRYIAGRFPYRGVGRAVAQECHEGWIKVLSDPDTGEILGTHVFGPLASEQVHELLLARSSELVIEDIEYMIHSHPSFSEGLREAVLELGDGALHI